VGRRGQKVVYARALDKGSSPSQAIHFAIQQAVPLLEDRLSNDGLYHLILSGTSLHKPSQCELSGSGESAGPAGHRLSLEDG
jgi:hypothetical protein